MYYRSGVEEPNCERDQLLQEISSLCKESNYNFKDPRKKSRLTKEQQLCRLGQEVRASSSKAYYEELKLEKQETANSHESLQNGPQSAEFHIEDHDYIVQEYVPSEVQGLEDQLYILPDVPPDNEIPPTTPNVATPRSVQIPTRRRLKPREPVRKNAPAYLNEKSNREIALKEKELELQERRIIIDEKRVQFEERKMLLDEKRYEADAKEKVETLRICQKLLESHQEI